MEEQRQRVEKQERERKGKQIVNSISEEELLEERRAIAELKKRKRREIQKRLARSRAFP